MAKQDFYDILGVGKSADADELKRAYRKLAMQFHPDRNAGDKSAEQRFKDVSEAYDVLKDDQKRAAYDRFGHAAFENGSRGPGDFAGGFSGGFANIFEEMFGAMGGGRAQSRARARSPAEPARDTDGFAGNRAFSRSSKPARPARARAKPSKSRARPA